MMKAALESMGEAGAAEANASVVASPFGYPNLGANIAAFKTRPSSEWLADLWANDIPVQPAQSFGEVFADEQARANTYVVDVEDPEVGTITAGGLPLTVTPPTRVRFARPATTTPAAEVIEQWSPRAESAEVGRSLRWPLEGLKVLDLGNYLAGPYGPMVMADMGADVIKIESTAGDAMRPTGWAFAGCQRGKRSISLDLKDPVARPALEALIRWADVVHHNVRMPAAYRIGIDYESVRALNPNVIYCHTSSYGPVGPRADWPGYDQLFQAFCGWEVLGAGEGNPPMWHRFGFMDHQCALSSVVATLLALLHRERTGEGQAVAGSLLGAGALTTSESHLLADGSLAPIAGLNSDQTKVRPGYEILELADGWVAVACHTSAQLHSYCQVAGVTDPGQAPAALRTRFQSDVLAALEEAKVPSEPVRLAQRYPFFDDAANQAAGLVATYQSAEFGKLEQPGALWYFGDMDVRLEMAPPALGEHTVEILRSVGFDDHQIEVLLASGAAKAFAPDAS
jgi:crotonobetainyl-CoA:carnitine CoA-transferase CaiB-like acyl-CoA transferase